MTPIRTFELLMVLDRLLVPIAIVVAGCVVVTLAALFLLT
jgi:hypothetical protein